MKKIIITMFMLAGIVSLRAQAPAHISFQKKSVLRKLKSRLRKRGNLSFWMDTPLGALPVNGWKETCLIKRK